MVAPPPRRAARRPGDGRGAGEPAEPGAVWRPRRVHVDPAPRPADALSCPRTPAAGPPGGHPGPRRARLRLLRETTSPPEPRCSQPVVDGPGGLGGADGAVLLLAGREHLPPPGPLSEGPRHLLAPRQRADHPDPPAEHVLALDAADDPPGSHGDPQLRERGLRGRGL